MVNYTWSPAEIQNDPVQANFAQVEIEYNNGQLYMGPSWNPKFSSLKPTADAAEPSVSSASSFLPPPLSQRVLIPSRKIKKKKVLFKFVYILKLLISGTA